MFRRTMKDLALAACVAAAAVTVAESARGGPGPEVVATAVADAAEATGWIAQDVLGAGLFAICVGCGVGLFGILAGGVTAIAAALFMPGGLIGLIGCAGACWKM